MPWVAKIWSFFNEKTSRNVGFWPFFLKAFTDFFHFYVILVDIQPIYAKLDPSKIYWNTPLHPAYLPSHIHCGHIPLFRMVSEEIALQFAVTHGRTDGRELVNIEIDMWMKRARAKILVEINPLGQNHTPPHLFLAKNVILSKFCHGYP